MNIQNIENKLYEWVNTESGISVIWNNPNAPRPDPPFITLNINALIQINQDYKYRPKSATSGIDITGDREFTLIVNCYGSGAKQKLENLRTSLQKPTVQYLLDEEEIVFVDSLGINDLTAILNTKYEERSQTDLLFRVPSLITDSDVDIIENVNIEADYYNQENTLIYEDELNI